MSSPPRSKNHALAPHRLELEITESLLLEKSSETLDILKSLKELGVVIALDDFGTGYSGLGYLNSFPIDKIKIDRSFIKDLGIKPSQRNWSGPQSISATAWAS